MIVGYKNVHTKVIVLRMCNYSIINYNYLIVDTISKQSVIVDPAWEMDKIEEALELTQSELKGILLTHSHSDHTNLAITLSERYSCPIWMSNIEISYSGYSAKRLEGFDIIPWRVGAIQISPLFTPGHTPGSISYLVGDCLFTGDTLFAEGCGFCPDRFSADTMFTSLQYLKHVLRPGTLVFPGHSYGKAPGLKFSQLIEENIYLQIDDRKLFVDYRTRKGQKTEKLFDFK